MLFKIEAAVRLEYTRETCTDVACKWNSTSKRNVECAPMAKINFYSDTFKAKIKSASHKSTRARQPPSEERKKMFLAALNATGEKVYRY